MPPTDSEGSSSPFASFGRSIFGIRRDQVHAMDGVRESSSSSAQDPEIDSVQQQIADRFHDLLGSGDELLSLSWIRRLLEAFICIQDDFWAVIFQRRAALSKPPLDRMITEFSDRSLKALDLCNAIREGVDRIRQWQKRLEIVICALDAGDEHAKRPLGEGQVRRARKALAELAVLMLDDKDAGASTNAYRNRSFGHQRDHRRRSGGHCRSLSWSVSRSWSASRHLQEIGSSLIPPRGNEVTASGGLAAPVYAMSSVVLFTMWALVAAIPCQDRGGLQVNFSMPRQLHWAAPILALYDRILKVSKKIERRNSSGLLMEIYQIEKCVRLMIELADSMSFPLSEEKETELRQAVKRLAQVCEALKNGLSPLERLLRDVFHRIVRTRTECMDCLTS